MTDAEAYNEYEANLAQAYASGNYGQIQQVQAAGPAYAPTSVAAPYDNAQANYDVALQRAQAGGVLALLNDPNADLTVDHAVASGTYVSAVPNTVTAYGPIIGYFPGTGGADPVNSGPLGSGVPLAQAQGAVSDALQRGDIAGYHAAIDSFNQARALAGLPNTTDIQSDIVVLAHALGTPAGILADQVAQGAISGSLAPLQVPASHASGTPVTPGTAVPPGGVSSADLETINRNLYSLEVTLGIGTLPVGPQLSVPPPPTFNQQTQTVPTPGLPVATQSGIPATTLPPQSGPIDARPTTGTIPAGTSSAALGTSQGASVTGSLAFQIQQLGGGVNALLTPDQWAYFFEQASAVAAPAPEDLGFSRPQTPIKFADWWGAMLAWATAQINPAPASAAATVASTTGGGPAGTPGTSTKSPATATTKANSILLWGILLGGGYLLWKKG